MGCLVPAACASTGYRTGDPVVRVMPSKRYWIKQGATDDDAKIAGQKCSQELRQDPLYMAAVNDAADIAKKWQGNPLAYDGRPQKEAGGS